jgi:hypothetical protein
MVLCIPVFVTIVVLAALLLLTGQGQSRHDGVTYWAAGQQLVHHRNPYSWNEVVEVERSIGFPKKDPAFLMRNPPSALLLVMPLGWLGFRAAELLWFGLLAACLAGSVQMLWQMFGRNDYARAVGWTFGPAMACLLTGQSSLFVLLGLVLFLRWEARRPWLAGCALWLCALKPHLFLPLGLVLLVWIVVRRRYQIVGGLLLAVAVSSGVAYLLDPHVWGEYRAMMMHSGVAHEFIPCLSVALHLWVRPSATWLQYAPAVLGSAWALWYFGRRREGWEWKRDGMLLLMVSFVVAPYSWVTDLAVMLPALVQQASAMRSRNAVHGLALMSAGIAALAISGAPMHSLWYIWAAPMLFAWYLYARWVGMQPVAQEMCSAEDMPGEAA